MFILIDTNVYIQDFNLTSFAYKELINNSYQLGIRLFVSSFVFDEVIINYEQRLREFNKQNLLFKNIVSEKYLSIIPNEDIDQMVEDYKKKFEKQLLNFNSYGTRFVGFESANIESVYRRALKKEKPFSENGKGFKDALIWENLKWIVKTYCSVDKKLAFITNNLSDFSDEKRETSKDWFLPTESLRREYVKEGFSEDTLRIFTSIQAFNKNVVYKRIQDYNDLIQKLNSSLNNNLINYITNFINDDNKFSIYDERVSLYSFSIKEVISVKVIDAFNRYAYLDSDVVFEIMLQFLCEPINFFNIHSFQASAETYVHFNTKTTEFTLIEPLFNIKKYDALSVVD